jgi:hypothetical protein
VNNLNETMFQDFKWFYEPGVKHDESAA